LAWTIDYTATARKQLRHLDRPIARRIVNFMDQRIADQADPRSTGQALTGPLLGAYGATESGTTGSSATSRTARCACW